MPTSPPRTKSIAVCIDTRDGGARHRLHGIAQYIRHLGWRMMLVRQSGEAAAMDVARLAPDGIIAYVADRWLVKAAAKLSIPLVDTAVGEVPVPLTVSLDNDALSHLAMAHFKQIGLKHFGYCGVAGRVTSEQREVSFAACLEDRVLPAFSEPISEGESGLEPLMNWLKELPKPIGLLVFDDKLGERVLTACRGADILVPHQVAVIGIGNDELMCEVSHPTLSSFSLPSARFGLEAAKMLTQAMTGKKIKIPHLKIQPTGIVTRGSTDMVAVEDELIKAAIRFIRTQAGNAIGVKHVAQALNVSRRTLDRRFAGALNRTIGDELKRVRMQLAQARLSDDSQSVSDVARSCGYSTASAFSRAFHQNTGCWPSEYRRELRS